MSFVVDATYEDGVLKPNDPLPFNERERVRVTVESKASVAQQTAGMISWKGDAEVLHQLAEASEFGISESP